MSAPCLLLVSATACILPAPQALHSVMWKMHPTMCLCDCAAVCFQHTVTREPCVPRRMQCGEASGHHRHICALLRQLPDPQDEAGHSHCFARHLLVHRGHQEVCTSLTLTAALCQCRLGVRSCSKQLLGATCAAACWCLFDLSQIEFHGGACFVRCCRYKMPAGGTVSPKAA